MVNGYTAQHVIALQVSHRIHANSPYCTWRKLRPLPKYINDDSSFLGCDAASTGSWFPAFQKNMSPSSSGVDGPVRNATNLAFFVDITLGWNVGKKITEQFYPWLKTATSFQSTEPLTEQCGVLHKTAILNSIATDASKLAMVLLL